MGIEEIYLVVGVLAIVMLIWGVKNIVLVEFIIGVGCLRVMVVK